MASEKKTGLGGAAAGLLRPPTRPEPVAETETVASAEIAEGPGQGGEPQRPEETQAEGRSVARAPRRRKAVASAPAAKLEGRRLYLPEGTHFRLRIYAYQRGQKLSEAAEELLDRALPKYNVERAG
jgi:hypothetical protein